MTYNSNFCNNFPQFTFQYPPPSFVTPPLPPFLVPPRPAAPNPTFSDQEFIKRFDNPPVTSTSCQKSISISIAKEKLQNLIITLNNLKNEQKHLSEHNNTLSESQWSNALAEIEQNKQKINKTMAEITSYLDTLTKLLAKRSAKRLRLNKLRTERKKEKEDQIKEMEERSRKIDENLQKIQNDIRRAKQARFLIFLLCWETPIVITTICKTGLPALRCQSLMIVVSM